MTLTTPTTPPPVYFATRQSSHQPTQQAIYVVAVNPSDEPLKWATQDHAETIHSEAIQARQPKCLVATANVTPAPYTRSLRIIIETDDFPDFPVDLAIIATSENADEVQAAMESDVSRFVTQAEDCGWEVRHSWSDSRRGVHCSVKCHAEAVLQHSGETTWWEFWMQPVKSEVAARVARDGIRVPTAEEEMRGTILGERLLDWKKYEAGDKSAKLSFAKLSWKDMGLERVVELEGKEED